MIPGNQRQSSKEELKSRIKQSSSENKNLSIKQSESTRLNVTEAKKMEKKSLETSN